MSGVANRIDNLRAQAMSASTEAEKQFLLMRARSLEELLEDYRMQASLLAGQMADLQARKDAAAARLADIQAKIADITG